MRPKKQETTGSSDLFRARLDQIINMRHELVQLAVEIDWHFGALQRQRQARHREPFRTGQAGLPHPALGQAFTPLPTAGRAQAGTGVRARSAVIGLLLLKHI